MPRSQQNDDEFDEIEGFDELANETDDGLDDVLNDPDDELTVEFGDDLDDSLDDDDDEDDDEEELGINRETEDWSESLDDMESDYWEDYTRGG